MRRSRREIFDAMPDEFTLAQVNEQLRDEGHAEMSLVTASGFIKRINASDPATRWYKVTGEEAWRRKELGEFIAWANTYGASWRHKVQIIRREGKLIPSQNVEDGDEFGPAWLRFETEESAQKFIEVAELQINVAMDVSNHSMWSNKS